MNEQINPLFPSQQLMFRASSPLQVLITNRCVRLIDQSPDRPAFNPAESCQSILKANAIISRVLRAKADWRWCSCQFSLLCLSRCCQELGIMDKKRPLAHDCCWLPTCFNCKHLSWVLSVLWDRSIFCLSLADVFVAKNK